MKKYLSYILPLIIVANVFAFFLQKPQDSFAIFVPPQKTVNETCTCYDPGIADGKDANGNQINNNWYHCGPVTSIGGFQGPKNLDPNQTSYLAVGSCSNAEDGCFKAPDTTTIDPQHKPLPGGANKYNFTSVTCKTGQTSGGKQAIQCQCDTDAIDPNHNAPKNGRGEPTSIACRNNRDAKPQWKAYGCGGAAACITSPNLYYTDNDNGGVKVYGAACEQSCICQGTKGKPGEKSGVGNGNNGKQCYGSDGTLGGVQTYCTHREEYCENDPNATDGIKCVNNTVCQCNAAKTAINCTSKASGLDAAGHAVDQTFTVDCSSSNKQCQTGNNINDPNFTAFNQPVYHIACEPLPSLPPNPSPPCGAWSNGTCISFNTGVGALSTGTQGFVTTLFSALLSVSGGIALLLIIRAGYQLMTAQGKPEQLQQGRDQLIAAIVGLIFLIFSFVFLQLIGFDILHLPGFQGGGAAAGTCNPSQCVPTNQCQGLLQGTGKACISNGCPTGQSCQG